MLTKDEIIPLIRPLKPIPTGLQPSGSSEEKVHCLIFDIYGTLFISGSGDISISMQQSENPIQLERLLGEFGMQKPARETLRDFYKTIQQQHEEMKKKGVDFPEVQIDRIWMDVLSIVNRQTARDFAEKFEMMVNPVYPMPHLNALLVTCKQKRIPLGIISNAQFYTLHLFHWFLDSTPEQLGFEPDLTFLSYRIGQAKPSELPFRLAAEKLADMGIPVERSLYIGNDMLNDVYPAQQVGFKTALFAGDARSLRLRQDHRLCKTLSVDLVITDLIQLVDHV